MPPESKEEEGVVREPEHGPTAATSNDRTSAGNVTGTPKDEEPFVPAPETATASAAGGRRVRARGGKKGEVLVKAAGAREFTEAERPEDANAVAKAQREEKTGETEHPHQPHNPVTPPIATGATAAGRAAAPARTPTAAQAKAAAKAEKAAAAKAAKAAKGTRLSSLKGGNKRAATGKK